MQVFSKLLCFVSLILLQCHTPSKDDLSRIAGYWEIESVHAHGETFYPKGGSPVVDFYHFISDQHGVKKKLHPNFSGIYESSNDMASFNIERTQDGVYLSYDNALEPWKEKLIKINASQLILFHNEKEYRYKRHQKTLN